MYPAAAGYMFLHDGIYQLLEIFMPVRTLIAFAIALIVIDAHGQLTERDTLRFGIRVSTTGSWITGNVERLIISNMLDVSHLGKVIGVKSSNSYIYGTIFKNETENDLFSRNFLYLNPRKRIYPYAMLWLQHSQRQQIQFRYQAGVGVTYTLINNQSHLIKTSATLSKENTRYNGTIFAVEPENLDGDEVENYRVTARLFGHHSVFENKLRLQYETWYQPAFGDSENWRYQLNASIEIPLTKLISFRTSLIYAHDNIVLSSIKRDDKILTLGLTISNY